MLHKQSTTISKEASLFSAVIIVSRRGESTTSVAGISLNHELIHSKSRGFTAASATGYQFLLLQIGKCTYMTIGHRISRDSALALNSAPVIPEFWWIVPLPISRWCIRF
jgi:hypothetical protein